MTDSREPAPPPSGPTAAEVAGYLRRHPDFLNDHPDLALTLVVPKDHGHGRAASLAGYQLEVLRDKNRELAQRIRVLVAIASENETLMRRVHALNLALMRARGAAEAMRRLVAALREDFATEQVRVLLHHPDPELPAAEWLLAVPDGDPSLAPVADVIERGEPLCGRLTAAQAALLFEEPEAIGSCALLPLPGLGLLAIASTDPNRFHPGQGTFFLDLIAQTVAAALRRHG